MGNVLKTLLLAVWVTLLATPAMAVEPTLPFVTCVHELRSVFYDPGRPNHAIVAQKYDEKAKALAEQYRKATDEVYELFPNSPHPQHARIELRRYDRSNPASTLTENEIAELNSCVFGTGKMICGIPIEDVDERLLMAVYQHELTHLFSLENLKAHHPELWKKFIAMMKSAEATSPEVRLLALKIDHLTDLLAQMDEAHPLVSFTRQYQQIRFARNYLYEQLRLALAKLNAPHLKTTSLWTIWSSMDEVMADTVPVLLSGDPKVIDHAVQSIAHKEVFTEGRDFSRKVLLESFGTPETKTAWNKGDVHLIFTPVRSHLWEHYLQHASRAEQKKLIKVLQTTMVEVIRKAGKDPALVLLDHVKGKIYLRIQNLNRLWIEEIDQAMGRAPEAQRALNKGNPSEIPKLLAP